MRYRFVFFILPLVIAGPAIAGPREDTLAGIARCSSLADDRLFLDCIYGAAQPMRERLGLSPAPLAQRSLVPGAAPVATPAMAPRPQQPEASGKGSVNWLSSLVGADGKSLHMTSYSFDSRGFFTAAFSDGEIWRQDPNDTNFAHWGGKAGNYDVTLTPGTYKTRLDVRGEPGPYLVQRIK